MAVEKMARALRYIVFGVLGALIVYLAFIVNVEVVDLDKRYDPKTGYAAKYFSQKFPSAQEIEDYWRDATLVISDPQHFGNIVRYFDDHRQIISWFGSRLAQSEWNLSSVWQLLKFDGHARFVVIQKFCTHSSENPDGACQLVSDTGALLNRGTSEYRKSDIFGLAGRKNPPFPMPKAPISTDMLLAQLSK